MKILDNFLDKITMYRLMLYFLLLLLGVAVLFCFLGIFSYNPYALLFSAGFLVLVCLVINKIFATAFDAPANTESAYITALILALIINPARTPDEVMFLFWAGTIAMASKYILAIHKKHIFNPAALAVTVTALGLVGGASWWIGLQMMIPFILLGLLIVRKIRRFDLLLSFCLTTLVMITLFTISQGGNVLSVLRLNFFDSSLFFFALVMLTEPLTTPPTRNLRILYGILVGVLFTPQLHFGGFNATPELALVVGNIFSYLVSPKVKLVLHLKEKIAAGKEVFEFIFPLQKKLSYLPGQYMEWTLPHSHVDSRGNRRYFTIASSPTEDSLRLGIRVSQAGSSFKKALLTMTNKTKIVADSLRGDFTLPSNTSKKLVFIAGGIGITPFRSMIKYLIDTQQKRSIVLFYANKEASEIAYADVFDQAQKSLGIKTIYTLTEETKIPKNWKGNVGRIDAQLLTREVPDFKERLFYLSGPHGMVVAYEDVLKSMGVPAYHIKKDFFPGYA